MLNKTAVVLLGAPGGPNETFPGAKSSVRAEEQTLEQRLRHRSW